MVSSEGVARGRHANEPTHWQRGEASEQLGRWTAGPAHRQVGMQV